MRHANALVAGLSNIACPQKTFANVTLHDARHNRGHHSIHNHFLIKSLHLVRPGGLVVALTSRFTLDAQNPAARREMAELADLVGALRLPAGAFRQVAGTDVVIDLLILRRRPPGDTRQGGVAWERSVEVATADGPATINEVFAARPDWVLGELSRHHGQYNDHDLTVRPGPEPLERHLARVLADMADAARAAGLAATARVVGGEVIPIRRAAMRSAHHKEGSLLVTATGMFARVENGVAVRFQPNPKNGAGELRAAIAVRDALHEVLDAQTASIDDTAWEAARGRLNHAYDNYFYRYGALNRFTLAPTGRHDPPDTGEATYRRMTPRMGGFAHDPDLPAVLALEMFDPDTGHAAKAAIFERRVLEPRHRRLGADTAEEALAICLDEQGRPDVDHIASLLGVDPADARARLGQLVFDDPADGSLVTATAYLSGNVRAKLALATEAAAADGRWQVNVDALAAVQPADLGPGEIDAHLGAPWIPAGDVADFAHDILNSPGTEVDYDPAVGWTVTAPAWQRRSVAATSEWGTARADAIGLLHSAANQQAPTVYDYHDDGTRSVNNAETADAREKADAITARFAAWIWEDPDRANRLAERYNTIFNATVLPVYRGGHLSVPGLSAAFTPRAHQLDAAWRMMSEPTVLLAHFVGAGKTATMIIGGRELKRLGLINKPAYVVPGHMLEQFSREYLQLFPQARILVATKDDVTPARRKNFVARCATGDWDAVIMTRSSFELIPVSADAQSRFLAAKTAAYRAAIEAAKDRGGLSVKQLQKALVRVEEKHRTLLAAQKKDDGISFESTGIDYLAVDEAQYHKGLYRPSRIQDAAHKGAQRAEDLAMKLAVLRNRHGPRVCTLATATPIANSIAEMWVMQSYLQPAALEAAGLAPFDGWAATFGRTVTAVELSPDGSSYRMSSRFARFANVPELLTMFGAVADVVTRDDLADGALPLDVPDIAGGGPQIVIVPPGDGLTEYMAELLERAEKVRNRQVRPEQDNMLAIGNDGRAAALDLRLVGRPPDDTGKVAVAAERITALWEQTRHLRYRAPDGTPWARPGALQLVFCDLSTPKKGKEWSVYQDLRDRLHAAGIPHGQVRFIHEAPNDKAKGELFAACRDGRVSVLIGSTDKMGVGVNVQARMVAIHHLDCPWWPSSNILTEGGSAKATRTTSSTSCATPPGRASTCTTGLTLERKAAFIHQVTQGEAVGREVDDVGEQALSFAEVKALATGNPLILERAGLENDIAKLERLARAHHREQRSLLVRQREAAARAELMDRKADLCDTAVARRVDTRADRFAMTVEGVEYRSRVDAAVRLRLALLAVLEAPPPKGIINRVERVVRVAEVGGFGVDVDVTSWPDGRNDATMRIEQLPVKSIPLEHRDVHQNDPTGLIARLENRLHKLEETGAGYRAEARASRDEGVEIAARIGRPFEYQTRLETHRARLRDIEEELTPDPGAAGPGPTEPGAGPDPRPSAAAIAPAALTARLPASPESPQAANPELAVPPRPVPPTPVSTPQADNTAVAPRPSPPPSVLRGADRLSAERAALETELAKLDALAAAHREKRHRLERRKAALMSEASTVGKKLRRCEAALERGVDTAGGRFVWSVIDAPNYRATEFRSRDKASQQLRLALLALVDQHRPTPAEGPAVHTELVGRLCSFRVEADVTSWSDGRATLDLRVDNLPLEPVTVELGELTAGNPAELLAALESRIATIPEIAANYRAEEIVLRTQQAQAAARLDQPFEHQLRLDTLRGRLRDIEDLVGRPETPAPATASAMASIRRLPRRPQPDDPVTVTEYDDCPVCLSSDLRSVGEDETDQVRCKECGWVGSYPPHPRLVAVPSPPPQADPDPHVYRDTPSIPTAPGDHLSIGAHLTASTTEDTVASAAETTTATAAASPALAEGGPAPALPSIHQQHQLHQQLYPGPQAGPIIQP